MWLFTHLIWECLTLLWVTYQISKRNRLILFWRRNHPKCLTPANLRGQRSDFETSFLMALHLSLLISPIVHCYPLYRALWSFIERGGSKLLIEMGQRGSSGCKFILIPQRDVRDYSRAPSWQGKDFGQVTTLDSGGTLVVIYQIHTIFCFYFWSWFFSS